MKKNLITMAAVLFVFFTFCPGLIAGQKATEEDCVDITKEAAKMITEQGLNAALEKINDKKGPFVRNGTYVFCFMQDTVKMIGNPYSSARMRDLSLKDYIDANGKLVFQEFIKVVKEKKQGWVEYIHVKKAGEKPLKKKSFVYKIPDTMIIVGAGIYE